MQTIGKESIYDKTLNCAKLREKVQISPHQMLVFVCRGILARQGASLEIPFGEPISLWPFGAAGVQIPLSAPAWILLKVLFEALAIFTHH
jgi:hypothetical protein